MREDLIKILANISEDYVGTIEKLEEYIKEKTTINQQVIKD